MSDAMGPSAGPLVLLAEHNAWANGRVLSECKAIPEARLAEEMDGYDSILGIVRHLVQVENNFFALAHDRDRISGDDVTRVMATLADAAQLCARVDRDYVEYARSLEPAAAEAKRFLVPWFGFEITLAEGILQPLTHSHKHRADISMLLPRLGGEGVEMDLIQWLAESRSPSD